MHSFSSGRTGWGRVARERYCPLTERVSAQYKRGGEDGNVPRFSETHLNCRGLLEVQP